MAPDDVKAVCSAFLGKCEHCGSTNPVTFNFYKFLEEAKTKADNKQRSDFLSEP